MTSTIPVLAAGAGEAGAVAAATRPRVIGQPALGQDDGATPSEATPLVDKCGKMVVSEKLAALSICETVDELERSFGWEFLVMLSSVQHLTKGFGQTFTQPCRRFLLAAYKVPGPQMQVYTSVSMLPWAMKPVVGLLSDAVPIFGYHKLPYMFLASVLGIFGAAMIGFTEKAYLSVIAMVGCFFLVEQMIAVTDLLTEAKYAEKMRQTPTHAPALASFVWFGLNFGALVAVSTCGYVMSTFGNKAPFMIVVFPLSLVFIPLLRNYLQDRPREAGELAAFREQLAGQMEVCFLCFVMFLGTVSLTVLGIVFRDTFINAVGALCVALVVLISFSIFLRPIIARVNAFFLIQSSLTLSIEGASFYFYTDQHWSYEEGPHFSTTFYVSVLGVVGTVFSLLGIWTYNRYATGWKFRHLMLVTNVCISVLFLIDLLLFARVNVKLGIPDHFFVLGSSVFENVIRQWQWMPAVILNSQLCPAGMEATMYGLLVGSNNLGMAIAQNCGALLLDVLGVAPDGSLGESGQFTNLWIASLVSTVLPAITLILIPFLIPDACQTDKLLSDDDRDASLGSLWRRWTGRGN